jgi:hypothetical protein
VKNRYHLLASITVFPSLFRPQGSWEKRKWEIVSFPLITAKRVALRKRRFFERGEILFIHPHCNLENAGVENHYFLLSIVSTYLK